MDEIVRCREYIVKPPGVAVRAACMPIEPRPALLSAKPKQVLDERAGDAMSAQVGGDEEVLKIANRPGRP